MRTYYLEDGTVAPVGKELVVGNKSWPKNLWPQLGEEKLTELGITWKDTEPALKVDSKYQWPSGEYKILEDRANVDDNGDPILDEKGKQLITRGLKYTAIMKIKQEVSSKLAPTDFYFTRELDRNIPVPFEVRAYRAKVAEFGGIAEQAIKDITSSEDLQIFMNSNPFVWPEPDEDYSDWVPKTVSMRQARLALLSVDLLGSVQEAIKDNPVAQIEWEYAKVIDRTSPLLPLLNKTDEELDELFRSATKIQ